MVLVGKRGKDYGWEKGRVMSRKRGGLWWEKMEVYGGKRGRVRVGRGGGGTGGKSGRV